MRKKLVIFMDSKKNICDRFVKFIQTMQKGNVLIGCEYGTKDTDYAICLDKFFNPKADIMGGKGVSKQYGVEMQRIYENLSPEDKKAMGWDEEFDKNFIERLKSRGFYVDD